MKILIFILGLMICGYNNLNAINNLVKVDDIKIKESGENFRIQIKFNKPFEEEIKKPLLGGNFIQFSFNNTYVDPSRQVVKASGNVIERAMLYQYNRSLSRLRIFLNSKKLDRKLFDNIIFEKSSEDILNITYRPDKNLLATKTDENKATDPDIITEIDKKAALHQAQDEIIKNENIKADEKELETYFTGRSDIKAEKTKTTAELFGKMFISLGLVIAMVLLIAWLFKRFTGRGSTLSINNKIINFITREYIGPKNYLALVKVMNKYALIGVSNENISALMEFDNIPEEFLNLIGDGKTQKNDYLKEKNKNEIIRTSKSSNTVFKKIIKDVSERIVPLKKSSQEQEDFKKDCNLLTKMGEDVLRRRQEGLEKVADADSCDPFIKNLSTIIKDRVKDFKEL